jgi:hypothetical protein
VGLVLWAADWKEKEIIVLQKNDDESEYQIHNSLTNFFSHNLDKGVSAMIPNPLLQQGPD